MTDLQLPPVDGEGLIDLARGLASTSSVSGTEEAAVRLVEQALIELGFDEVGSTTPATPSA